MTFPRSLSRSDGMFRIRHPYIVDEKARTATLTPKGTARAEQYFKVENLSALAETLLLFATCFWVVYEGLHRLIEGGSPVEPSIWGMLVMAFSVALDINRVRILRKVAAKHKSQALEADALHFATDILSSFVVLVGVSAVWLADKLALDGTVARLLTQADTVAALIVAVIIFQARIRMARAAINTLMDSGSVEEQEAIRERVERVPGILAVQRVRQRTSASPPEIRPVDRSTCGCM